MIVWRGLHAGFVVPDRLVGEIPDRTAAEGRQIGARNQIEAVKLLLDQPQRVDLAAALRPNHAIRLGPDERVAARPLPALNRLEQERIEPALDLQEGRDGVSRSARTSR